MNGDKYERMRLKYWWKYGDRGEPNRTLVVTNDQSEAFLNIVQHNFLGEELLAPRPKPILEDHPCRLSETGYAMHLQLPSVKEFVPTSATWGRAMPWRQRLIAQGKAEGIGERSVTLLLYPPWILRWTDTDKAEVLGEERPSTISSTTNPTWADLRLQSGLRCEKPEPCRLSHRTTWYKCRVRFWNGFVRLRMWINGWLSCSLQWIFCLHKRRGISR
jgi:hypothetical protein